MVIAIEVNDKPASLPAVQTVLPVFTGPLDSNKPRFIITARALEDSASDELPTETEPETTENTTDETEESMTDDRLSSTESSTFNSTPTGLYSTESSISSTDEQSLVARTGEISDDPSVSSKGWRVYDHLFFYTYPYVSMTDAAGRR